VVTARESATRVPGNDATTLNRRARVGYAVSVVVIVAGAVLAAQAYPAAFDWRYRVVSALASHKHNPDGAIWFSLGLAVSLALLWPVTTRLHTIILPTGQRGPPFPVLALRVGLVLGVAVGLERAIFQHFSDLVRKGHEIIALLSFLSLYTGVIAAYARQLRRNSAWFWPAILVLVPVIGVGVSELLLYLDQRDVGWADHDWRETGLPVWLSFAFWQWLGVVALWLSVGGLAWMPAAVRSSAPADG
jgi:drug/metabolite transporter (DMT)-like permease